MSSDFLIHLEKDQVLCKEGDSDTDMYILHEGQLLICVRKGTQVTAIANINPGDYIGELSFFDNQPRSADVIATEKSTLIKISKSQLKQKFPSWLLTIAKFQANKIRLMDKVIQNKGIKKKNVDSIKPLSIEEQRHYLEAINNS